MMFIMLIPLRRISNAILFEISFTLAVRIVFNFGNGVRYQRVPWVIITISNHKYFKQSVISNQIFACFLYIDFL